jgi:hypothetical protein
MMRWSNLKNIGVGDVLGAVGLCRKSQAASGVDSFFFGPGVGLLAGSASQPPSHAVQRHPGSREADARGRGF